jgi:hypothetical protein
MWQSRKGDTVVPLARTAWEGRRTAQAKAVDAVAIDLAKAPVVLKVELLDPPPVAAPGERVDDRLTKWSDTLGRDPWLAEAAAILADATR